jgi:osmotically-inducible protein OsmY
MKQTPEKIKRDIVDHLYWDSRVDASKVNVRIQDSKAILTGSVPTFNAWESAQKDVLITPGINSVDNQLDVIHPEDIEIPSDQAIQENMHNMLKWNPDVDATDVQVIVKEGEVVLKGTVGSYWAKRLIQKLAGQVKGIIQVSNEIIVVPTKTHEDRRIAHAVTSALERISFIDTRQIIVNVENGEVTLSGKIPNHMAHQLVLETCYYTEGVKQIHDGLVIK